MNLEVDYYLTHRPRQPKRVIAEYVSRNGVLVPRIFDTLAEALQADTFFIARSEHTQDYDGVSGLLTSKVIKKGSTWGLVKKPQEEFEAKLRTKDIGVVETYCSMYGLDPKSFVDSTSYSYWEYIPGVKRVVAADSAILNRYHIFSYMPSDSTQDGVNHYTILEDGKTVLSASYDLEPEYSQAFPALIEVYDRVRHLPNFNPKNCPVMEMKTYQGQIYFLQYLLTQPFKPAAFVLDREPKADEIEAILVRGVTGSEGRIYQVKAGCALEEFEDWRLDGVEASLDTYQFELYHEFTSKQRQAMFITSDMAKVTTEVNTRHFMRSKLFKPPLSVVLDRDEADQRIFAKYGYNGKSYSDSMPHVVNFWVISDGRRAYVKPIFT